VADAREVFAERTIADANSEVGELRNQKRELVVRRFFFLLLLLFFFFFSELSILWSLGNLELADKFGKVWVLNEVVDERRQPKRRGLHGPPA
jgi:hypothetical protein